MVEDPRMISNSDASVEDGSALSIGRIGHLLLAYRKKRGLTQEQVASQSGVTGVHISQIERGKRLPTERLCMKLATALGCNPRELIKRVQTEKSPEVAQLLYPSDATKGGGKRVPKARFRRLEAWLLELQETLPEDQYNRILDTFFSILEPYVYPENLPHGKGGKPKN